MFNRSTFISLRRNLHEHDGLTWCFPLFLGYASWQPLHRIYESQKPPLLLKDLFAQDLEQPNEFCLVYVSPNTNTTTILLLDSSKYLIHEPIPAELLDLVREAGLEEYRDSMMSDRCVNNPTGRHVALRNFEDLKVQETGVDKFVSVLGRIRYAFFESIASMELTRRGLGSLIALYEYCLGSCPHAFWYAGVAEELTTTKRMEG